MWYAKTRKTLQGFALFRKFLARNFLQAVSKIHTQGYFIFSVKSIFGAIWEKGLRIKGTIGYNDSGCTFVPNDGGGCTHIIFLNILFGARTRRHHLAQG